MDSWRLKNPTNNKRTPEFAKKAQLKVSMAGGWYETEMVHRVAKDVQHFNKYHSRGKEHYVFRSNRKAEELTKFSRSPKIGPISIVEEDQVRHQVFISLAFGQDTPVLHSCGC